MPMDSTSIMERAGALQHRSNGDSEETPNSESSDEFDEEWQLAIASAPAVKAPLTRLLDLLAGWSSYAERCEFPDSEAVLSAIPDLYQEAGQFDFEGVEEGEQHARIRSFLLKRVLPVILTG